MDNIKITIVSGLAGSGKSTAIAVFEDAGFYCVDNMPVVLLPKFLELPLDISKGFAGFAFGMDLREKDFDSKYPPVFSALKDKGYSLDILFFESGLLQLLGKLFVFGELFELFGKIVELFTDLGDHFLVLLGLERRKLLA